MVVQPWDHISQCCVLLILKTTFMSLALGTLWSVDKTGAAYYSGEGRFESEIVSQVQGYILPQLCER